MTDVLLVQKMSHFVSHDTTNPHSPTRKILILLSIGFRGGKVSLLDCSLLLPNPYLLPHGKKNLPYFQTCSLLCQRLKTSCLGARLGLQIDVFVWPREFFKTILNYLQIHKNWEMSHTKIHIFSFS